MILDMGDRAFAASRGPRGKLRQWRDVFRLAAANASAASCVPFMARPAAIIRSLSTSGTGSAPAGPADTDGVPLLEHIEVGPPPSSTSQRSNSWPIRAAPRSRLLLPYAERCVVLFGLLCLGAVSRLLGLLATTLSRYEEADRHFEQALKKNAQMRSPLWVAHTEHDYAHSNALVHARRQRMQLGVVGRQARLIPRSAPIAEIGTIHSERSQRWWPLL
jgi:hypothetical protein